MSAVASPRRRDEPAPLTHAATRTDRLLAAVPLASIYVWLCIVYGFEAWKRTTPWLFTDELEFTQLSRSIAATGHPARRGEPHSFESLYTVVTAPFWWIHDTATAFAAIKYFDVFVMTSVLFPTYFLARMVVGKRWALFAAAGAAAIPSLGYSSWLVEETIAYPYAALCFLLIAKALVTRRRGWIAGAVAATIVAPAIKGELVVIPIVLFLSTAFAVWSSEWARERRRSWSVGDWVGCAALVAGAIIVVSGYLTWHSHEWNLVTSRNWTKHRVLVYGDWAAGALAIGLGVVPVVAGLASLFPARRERRSRELRMFRSVLAASVIGFGLYAAMKAAYLSEEFATRTEERNLIYVAPLLFVGTALVFGRRRVNLLALAGAAAYVLYLIVGTPFFMDRQLYSDALGYAILQQANRYYELTPATAQWILLGILAGGAVALAAIVLLRTRIVVATGLAAALAVGILAWNVTGEVSAAAGNVSIGRTMLAPLGRPLTWVDDANGRAPTLYLGQGVVDQNPEWLLEFWNRSIARVSSLDATLQGPGPAGSPNITRTGQLYWSNEPGTGPSYAYGIEELPCIDLAGSQVASHPYRASAGPPRVWRLIRLTTPNRLRAWCSGIYTDGWSGPNDSTYMRFPGKPGWLRITLSRQGWPATPVHIEVGRIGVRDKTAVIVGAQPLPRFVVRPNHPHTVWLRVPARGFGVRVLIAKKFVPREIDRYSSDPRTLGALVGYRFFAHRPPAGR